jgi:spore coat protein U-like protein
MRTPRGFVVAAALGVLASALLTSSATAGTGATDSPAAKITTTITLKATQVIGKTPGKVIFGVHVVAASGLPPQGTVALTVDTFAPVTLTLKSTGRTSYTHHYKPGMHKATAAYSGSSTDAPSTTTITFSVT